MDPLLTISFNSFGSVWFWIMLGFSWSMTCHWTLGVPYDVLVRADQKGGDFATYAADLARLNIERTVYVFGRGGAFITAMIFFVLAVIGTFGFFYDYELAQAIFVMLAPLALVTFLNTRLAFQLHRDAPDGPEICKALVGRRFWNQVIGLLSVVIAAALAFVSFVRHVVIWY